jgi:hypothetical protein
MHACGIIVASDTALCSSGGCFLMEQTGLLGARTFQAAYRPMPYLVAITPNFSTLTSCQLQTCLTCIRSVTVTLYVQRYFNILTLLFKKLQFRLYRFSLAVVAESSLPKWRASGENQCYISLHLAPLRVLFLRFLLLLHSHPSHSTCDSRTPQPSGPVNNATALFHGTTNPEKI